MIPVKCCHQKNGVSNVQTCPSIACRRCRLRTTDRTVETQTGTPSLRSTNRIPRTTPSERIRPCSLPYASKSRVALGRGSRCRIGIPGPLVAHFFVSAGTENSNAIGRRSLNTGVIPTITAIQPFWGFQIAQGCLSVPHRKSQCGPPSRFSAAQLVTNGELCRLANVGGSGRVRRCRSPYGCKLSTLAFGKLRASKRSE